MYMTVTNIGIRAKLQNNQQINMKAKKLLPVVYVEKHILWQSQRLVLPQPTRQNKTNTSNPVQKTQVGKKSRRKLNLTARNLTLKKGKSMASGKLIASNKKARHDYFIEDTYEAGIVLHGTEVKSLRAGHCSIKESFVRIENGEVIIYGMHINPYEKGNIFNKDPLRPKKLMLHKYEINKLVGKLNEKGLTLVPLRVLF